MACYQIKDYSDGDLDTSECTTCVASGDAAWDGSFPNQFGAGEEYACWWTPYVVDLNLSIDGVEFNLEWSQIKLVRNGVWGLHIVCKTAFVTLVVWDGEKAGGATPVGTYTRLSGCDATASLEIEECP